MIDLRVTLRSFALAIPGLAALLSEYGGSRALFTRRPAPQEALYPMAFISPLLDTDDSKTQLDSPLLDLQYFVSFYGENDSPEHYDEVEQASILAVNAFERADVTKFVMPSGWQLAAVRATGPRPAPVDDDKLVGRMVALRLLVKQG